MFNVLIQKWCCTANCYNSTTNPVVQCIYLKLKKITLSAQVGNLSGTDTKYYRKPRAVDNFIQAEDKNG